MPDHILLDLVRDVDHLGGFRGIISIFQRVQPQQ